MTEEQRQGILKHELERLERCMRLGALPKYQKQIDHEYLKLKEKHKEFERWKTK